MKKQLYTILIVSGCLTAVPKSTDAQCSCSSGTSPDSISYSYTLAPTANFTTPISFPKFDPTVGTLSCVELSSNISAVSNLGIRNLDSLQRDYEFFYTQVLGFSGPGGMSSNSQNTLHYGPTTLYPYGMIGDSVHYGPDTPFKNFQMAKTVTNVTPYLGPGTIVINFSNTGNTLLLQGSNNYRASVSTQAWGDFNLKYYWCAAGLLASGLKFYVSKKENNILLQWQAENELPTNRYEVLLSKDGRSFSAIASKSAVNSTSGKYEYQFVPEVNYSGKLFFRIRQIKANGQSIFSPIKIIDPSRPDLHTFQVFPNPVVNNMTIEFDQPLTGDYQVEIINSIGQPIYNKLQSVTNHSTINVQIDQIHTRGVYYLRIKDELKNYSQVQKIFLQ